MISLSERNCVTNGIPLITADIIPPRIFTGSVAVPAGRSNSSAEELDPVIYAEEAADGSAFIEVSLATISPS